MDDRTRLLELTKKHGVVMGNGNPFPSNTGLTKLQEALIDAGVEFELVETGSDRENEIEPAPEVTVEREEAAPKASAGMLKCLVIVKNVHVMESDLGNNAQPGISRKLLFKDRVDLPEALAQRLHGLGKVEII